MGSDNLADLQIKCRLTTAQIRAIWCYLNDSERESQRAQGIVLYQSQLASFAVAHLSAYRFHSRDRQYDLKKMRDAWLMPDKEEAQFGM